MNICVAHVMRTYGVHGGERQLAQLFEAFGDNRFSQKFYFVYRDPVCQNYFEKIPKLQMFTLLPLKSFAFPSLLFEFVVLLIFLPILQVQMIRSLKRDQCQICVAHGVQGALVSWLAALLLKQIRFVYVHRGTKSQLGKIPLFKLLYYPFDVVSGVSKASTQSLNSLVPDSKLRVLENGINLRVVNDGLNSCPSSKSSKLIISCVGRLLPDKGQSLIIEAFSLLMASHENCELWIIGDGPELDNLKALSKKLDCHKAVRFLGHSSKVLCLLSQSDIFVHASVQEGLSNAVLEAMAVKLPSVVVDAPGVSECHIDGDTGFIVERMPGALLEKWSLLCSDKALRQDMGERAYRRVSGHYSIEANWRRYSKLYQELLQCAA